jgi:hypothetical protein
MPRRRPVASAEVLASPSRSVTPPVPPQITTRSAAGRSSGTHAPPGYGEPEAGIFPARYVWIYPRRRSGSRCGADLLDRLVPLVRAKQPAFLYEERTDGGSSNFSRLVYRATVEDLVRADADRLAYRVDSHDVR